MNPTATIAAPGLCPAARMPAQASRARTAALLALLLGGATLAGCATTPTEQASQVAAIHAAATFAEAAATAYLTRSGADPKQRAKIAAGTAVLHAALDAWATAPADDAKAQVMQAALAGLTTALAKAGVMLAGQ